jgi:hypothetical protein
VFKRSGDITLCNYHTVQSGVKLLCDGQSDKRSKVETGAVSVDGEGKKVLAEKTEKDAEMGIRY